MDLHVSKELPSAQCYVAGWIEGELGGEWIVYMCGWSPFAVTPETITVLTILQYSVKGFLKEVLVLKDRLNMCS